jgi:hypothetical protein
LQPFTGTMKILRNSILAFTLFSLTFSSCTAYDKETSLISIEKEFEAKPWFSLSESGSQFQLIISTLEKQKCGGTKLDITKSVNSTHSTFDIVGLIPPSVCAGGELPISDTLSFQNQPNIKVKLKLKNSIENDISIQITPTNAKIYVEKDYGFIFPILNINKVPNQSVWAILAARNGEDLTRAQTIFSQIAAPISNLEKGYYGYFNVFDNNFEVLSDFYSDNTARQHSIGRMKLSNSELLLKLDQLKNIQGLAFKIWTSDGKVFKNN